MRREAFGPLAALNDADLARALVAIGVRNLRLADGASIERLTERYPQDFRWLPERNSRRVLDFTVSVAALQNYASRAGRLKVDPVPLAQWERLHQGSAPPATRYCIDLRGVRNDPALQIDLDWLTVLLGQRSVNPAGVFSAWPTEYLRLEWEWPLRVGVAPGPSAAAFRRQVERCAYRDLFVLADLEAEDSRCDVMVFSSGLHEAMRSALALGAIRASAVLVLGALGVPWAQASSWLGGLRRQFHAGAVGVCFVPSVERGAWFQVLVEELSHSVSLDRALFRASSPTARRGQAWKFPEVDASEASFVPAVILADRDFLDSTPLAKTAKRIGTAASIATGAVVPMPGQWNTEHARSLAERLRSTGAAVVSMADTLRWHQETGDATALREFRGSVEAFTGAELTLPAIVVGMTPAETRVRSPRREVVEDAVAPQRAERLPADLEAIEARGARIKAAPSGDSPLFAKPRPRDRRARQRRVQLDVFQSGENIRQDRVEPSTSYMVSAFVGAGRKATVRADTVVDEGLLTPSTSGHQIRMVFTPLWKGADGEVPAAQMQEVHLPPSGNSAKVQFHLTTPANLVDFRARLVLLHQYRVLQTLMLHSPLDATELEGGLVLSEENVVSADYGDTTVAPSFDAALIVNDNPQGITGLTTIAGGSAQFFEPAGFDKLLRDIRDDLASLNAPDAAEGQTDDVIMGLDDDRVHGLLYRLALRGAAMAKELKRQPLLGAFLSAPRLQVVDAVSGAFFPVELLYDGKPPSENAKRCEHSVAALEKQSVHDNCPNRASSDHICPAAFWGFSRCIERQPSSGQPGYGFAQPSQTGNALRPLKNVVFGASRRVREMDIVPPTGLEAVFTGVGMGYGHAKTWTDWTKRVGSESPSMLVLLPHSLNAAEAADLPALEIGGTEMPSVRIDETFVHGAGGDRPVVLILGCSTALPDIPFLSFVREFRFNGAAVTVGTLATIRGRQTVAFIKEFLAALTEVAQQGLTFDEAILRVKRRMLAKGDPFVLSLVAYGDTGWRVHI